jgi:hypothetical protein
VIVTGVRILCSQGVGKQRQEQRQAQRHGALIVRHAVHFWTEVDRASGRVVPAVVGFC